MFLDPGLGKTSIVLAALSLLKRTMKAGPTLIIAPLRVCDLVWPAEAKKWEDFKDLRIEVLHGPKKDEIARRPADIYIINPEGLEWLLNVTKVKSKTGKVSVRVDPSRLKAMKIERLVVDELTAFKHISSARFKAMKQVLSFFKQRWGLTGSPAANSLENLFGECYILDQGKALGQFITHFRQQYFHQVGNKYNLEANPGADKKIFEKIKPISLRMAAEDYLELPPQIDTFLWVDLPPTVRQTYEQMEEHALTTLGTKVLTAATAATALNTCRQMLSGAVYEKSLIDENDAFGLLSKARAKRRKPGAVADPWVLVHDAKIEALKELVDELQGQPLMVIYEFRHDLDRILSALGADTPYVGGGVSTAKSKRIEAAWNAGEIPVLLGHPQSMGHGLNLQSGNRIAFFTLTWDFELFDQVIRRLRRQGNVHKNIFVYYLMVRNSVDVDVLETLRGKDRTQKALFNALTRRRQAVYKAPR